MARSVPESVNDAGKTGHFESIAQCPCVLSRSPSLLLVDSIDLV